MSTFMCLGRNGDILNALQICYHEYLRTKQPVRLVVAREFEPLLLGFSYIRGIGFEGTQDELPRAMKELPYHDMKVIQSWQNPDQSRLTDSYQKEAWRRAGKLDAFGTVPLVVDRRDKEREAKFCSNFNSSKPWILVATKSPSSPFKWGADLLYALEAAFPNHWIIHISDSHAPRPYDLLGLFDRAALLVTIDSFPLHLARASRIPVIAILNDIGSMATPGPWTASVPPPQTVRAYKYSEFATSDAISSVIETSHEILRENYPQIIHAVQLHGIEPRHKRAMDTWNKIEWDGIYAEDGRFYRSSKDIGDKRSLPFLKDLLEEAMRYEVEPGDIIFWCNDDNAIAPELPAFLRKHVSLYGACSFRRTDHVHVLTTSKGGNHFALGDGTNPITPKLPHCGREGFAFTKRWLMNNWDRIPDMLLGFCAWDLCLAAIIRKERGIVTTKVNLTTEFWPADAGPGFVFHEPHASEWAKDENSPGNRYNRRLFRDYAAKELPNLRFDGNDNLV